MTLYKTTITPTSFFASKLQGDSIFGQMCWMIKFIYGNNKLEELLNDYKVNPFMIVSDGMPNDYFPKPTLPPYLLNEDINQKKLNKKKLWLSLEDLQKGNFNFAKTSEEIDYAQKEFSQIKNSLNYKTFKTDSKNFAPYSDSLIELSKSDIYFLIDEDRFDLKMLKKTFELLSKNGYGKDATNGKGRFEFSEFKKIDFFKSSTTFMALSLFSPKNLKAKEIFYEPITKFGKHGYFLANKNAFKAPLLLAKSGAVIIFDEKKDIQYIGRSIKNHSSHQNTIHQAYSIVLPIKDLLC